MLTIGNNELGERVTKGDLVENKLGHRGRVQYGTSEKGIESKIIGFIELNGVLYLVSVNDRLLSGCKKL